MKRTVRSRIMYLAFFMLGLLIMVYIGVLLAPCTGNGLIEFVKSARTAIENPLSINIVPQTRNCVLLMGGIYLFAALLMYTQSQGFRKGEEHGSARFGNVKSIARKYRDRLFTNNILHTSSFRLGLDCYAHQRNLNTVVIGGAGSGKSRGFVIPNILQANTSFVVPDPKGELLAASGNLLKEQGYKIRVINLYKPYLSDGYNPFVYLKCDDDVLRLVTNMWTATTEKGSQKSEQFWDDSARELLQALMFYLWYEAPSFEQTFDMILYLIRQITVDENGGADDNPIDIIFGELEDKDPDHIAVKYYQSFRAGASKTMMSIKKVLLSRLEKFNLKSMVGMTSTTADDLELLKMPKEKTALFCITPVADKSFNFIISMLYTQLFEILYEYGNEHEGYVDIPVHFLMEEAANITLPSDFPERLATMRSYRIFVSIILQNLTQLKVMFEKEWESILGHCDEFLYLGGNEPSTHQHISKMLDKQTLLSNSYGESRGRSGSTSKNTQSIGRDLMTAGEVRQLDNKLSILFVRGEYAVIDKKFDLMRHPNIHKTHFDGGKRYNHFELTEAAAEISIVPPHEISGKVHEISPTPFVYFDKEDLDVIHQ